MEVNADIQLVEYDEEFLVKSKKWLTDSEIKRLTMTPDLDDEEQQKWFKGLSARKDYIIKGILYEGMPIGAVGLKHIDYMQGVGEYWGYIGEKQYIGRGIGKIMVSAMCEQGVSLGLHMLVLKVAMYNSRAYQLYLKQGFEVVECNEDVVKMQKKL